MVVGVRRMHRTSGDCLGGAFRSIGSDATDAPTGSVLGSPWDGRGLAVTLRRNYGSKPVAGMVGTCVGGFAVWSDL